ncbi:LysR family transcriptional regulator [Rhodococcus sp. X156]|uniref:LysR family transcriptional regulator n=1 Tax=Rhodococcus sp. X156 TaxID=2499145 RepID=UPI000FDCB60F|nr:LysR family transcriptional regulator [Rhodococcus sp. X156]
MPADPRQLRHFVAVAEQPSFTKAARSLGVARTELSRSLAALQEQVGEPLVVPGEQPTRLTAAGEALLTQARSALAEPDPRGSETADDAPREQTFTVGYVPGVTLAKWSRVWSERMPTVPLRAVGVEVAEQVDALRSGRVDVCLVRLPVQREGLSVVRLYEEVPVVVVPKDHPVALFDAVGVADLADEHLLQDPDTVPEWRDVASELRTGERPTVAEELTDAQRIELVAAGLGIVVVPQSIARLHARRDLVYRPVHDVAPSPVALAWVPERNSDLVETFFGVVKGRTARSSRGADPAPAEPAPRAGRTRQPQKQAGGARGGRSGARGGARKPRRG